MKEKTKFICSNCGHEEFKWAGMCYGCKSYNTMVEETYTTGKMVESAKTIIMDGDEKPERLRDIKEDAAKRYSSGSLEFDRALGGGIVEGAIVLIGGDPGQGKSTLLLQVATYLTEMLKKKIYYFTGEESKYQTKIRATRLSRGENDLFVQHTRNVEEIERICETEKPDLIIVDSIQTLGDPKVKGELGKPTQVTSVTTTLSAVAKRRGTTIFIIGQVTKEGGYAGPKMLEHAVDTALYLEGNADNDLRMLRANKNRYGSTMDMGVFRMEGEGLIEVPNPSEYLLSNRLKSASGSAIVCISDKRPLLVEVQALVSPPIEYAPNPARTTHGFHRDRLKILIAVMQKKLNKNQLAMKDIFVNVASGMKVSEPGVDLGVLLALYSSDIDKPIEKENQMTMILGEVGLPGEVRPVGNAERLVKEAEKIGFTDCILPKKNYEQLKDRVTDINLRPVLTVSDAIKTVWR